jgi:uncharacterized iron-regulated protein
MRCTGKAHHMFKTIRLVFILACCAALPAKALAGGEITRLSDRQTVSFSQMMAEAAGANVILVAEAHDNEKDHATELDVIRSFQAKKAPLAIGLEMFQTDYQKQLDDWIEGRITEENFKSIYFRNWTFDWSLYRDIFIYARNNHIPMIALNIPKEIVSKVARQGFASLTPEERKSLPAGVTCDLNNPQTEFLRKTFQEVFRHEANGKIFANFCEAQAVRNNGMALHISDDLKRHPGRKLVVLTGVWHAVKYGIPERLTNTGNVSYKVILPEIAEMNAKNATSAIADYLVGR